MTKKAAVVGTGPASLMAAHVLASNGIKVQLFEKRASAGRKILVAGSSGLNISFDSPLSEFVKNYRGGDGQWKRVLEGFPPSAWIEFIESLGLETFRGTSGRFFVKGMKGSTLLQAWTERLRRDGVEFFFNHELSDFSVGEQGVTLAFNNSVEMGFSSVCLGLGGGSWEKSPVQWPKIFSSKGIVVTEFQPSNAGFNIKWPDEFLKEAEGKPLKSIVFHSGKASRPGELMITSYGMEGTPIYAIGKTGECFIDLKPALTQEAILKRMNTAKENLSPIRRVKKYLGLSDAALALVFHMSPKEILLDSELLASRIKSLPVTLGERQPLSEAISSSGGVSWDSVDQNLMLKKFPGIFLAGEMLDWDAPTGGFLIQGCVSQGAHVGKSMLKRF